LLYPLAKEGDGVSMIQMVAKVLKIINSENAPGQISLALCLAMVAGLTPFFSFHNLLTILLVLILRVNLSTFLLGLAVFSGIAYALDPLFHVVGLAVLTADSLQGLWTILYNSTFWRFSRFNNSILMGSLLFSLVLFIPLYLLANLAIRQYRARVLAWVKKSRVMQVFAASRFYSIYQSASGWWR
jgi:uncharacterized protein (TIGR03546 family)